MEEDFIRICQENCMKIHSLEYEVGLLKKKLEKYEENRKAWRRTTGRKQLSFLARQYRLPQLTRTVNHCFLGFSEMKFNTLLQLRSWWLLIDLEILHCLATRTKDKLLPSSATIRTKRMFSLLRRLLNQLIFTSLKSHPTETDYIICTTQSAESLSFCGCGKRYTKRCKLWLKPANARAPGARNTKHKFSSYSAFFAFRSKLRRS